MPTALYQEMEEQTRCFWTCSAAVFLLVAHSRGDLRSAGTKTAAAVAGLEHASCQRLIRERFCLLRPYFSPPCTPQTQFASLKASQSVSRQDAWRVVLGTGEELWPVLRLSWWALPANRGRGSSLNRFSKRKAGRWGCKLWKTNMKFQTFLDHFKTCFDGPGHMGFSARPFMIVSLSRRLTTALKRERKTNKKMQFNSKYLKRVASFGEHTAVFVWR